MGDDTTATATTSTDTSDTDEGHGDGLTLHSLDEKIDRVADMIKGLGRKQTGASKADQAADVAQQVRGEVDKIRQAEGRQKAREDRLGAIEAKVKEIAEKAPQEYRRITQFMWGDQE